MSSVGLLIEKAVKEISWVLFLMMVTALSSWMGACFWRFLLLSSIPPSNILTMFLTLVSSSEIPQGLFQRDAPICDISPTHQQSGADSFETHHLWVLTVLQERSLWLQQPRDRVELGVMEEPPMQCLLVKAGLPVQRSLPDKGPVLTLLLEQPADHLTSSYRVPEFGAGMLCLLMVTLAPMGNCYCPIEVECGLFPIVLPSHCATESVPCGRVDVAWLSWVLWAKPT